MVNSSTMTLIVVVMAIYFIGMIAISALEEIVQH